MITPLCSGIFLEDGKESHARISVIVPTWNGRHHLETCLTALRQQVFKNFKVILVDNGSVDGTTAFVQECFPEVEVITLDRNTGFAFANNLGIQRAFADPQMQYVVTLNNDTKPEPEYLQELIACAGRHPGTGSVQPKVINFYEPGVIDSAGILIARELSALNRGYREEDHGQYEVEEEIFGASASAALYSRDALEKVALPDRGSGREFFDNSYFAYYEDVDLGLRLRLAGFGCFYAPAARVHHVHSATGKSYSPFKSFHIHRNHYYNMIKNLPLPYLCAALAFMPIRYLLLLVSVLSRKGPSAKLYGQIKGKGSESLSRIVLRSWREVIVNLPQLLRKRRHIQATRTVGLREVERWLREFKADYRKIIFG